MGNVNITIKIMPDSPVADLKKIKDSVEKVIKSGQGHVFESKEEPIAFGLKALILVFSISESKELEPLEREISKIDHVNSTSILEMNRAL